MSLAVTSDAKYILVGVFVLAIGSAAIGRSLVADDEAAPDGAAVAVVRGDLEIKVTTIGSLIAPRSVTIASEIESNRAKIIRMAPEGIVVAEGDLLARFDPAPFRERATELQRKVEEASANVQDAEEAMRLLVAKGKEEAADARQRARLAELDLQLRREDGEPLRVLEARVRLERAERRVTQLEEEYGHAEAFLREGFITRQEYDRTMRDLEDAQRDLELARAAHASLANYQQPAEIERAEMQLERTADEAKRIEVRNEHEQRRNETRVTRARLALEAAEGDLAQAERELSLTELRAPTSGLLVYNELSIGSERRRAQVGDSVWKGQAIMTIPDTSIMAVDARLRERDVHKVREGQSAMVTLDALPGRRFGGTVEFLGNLATNRGRGASARKEFSMRVRLDETDPRMRPGMTARVDLDIDTREDVLLVPIEAVFESEDRTYCYVLRGDQTIERAVEVGKSNVDHVEILTGLSEGERVALAPTESRSWLWGG